MKRCRTAWDDDPFCAAVAIQFELNQKVQFQICKQYLRNTTMQKATQRSMAFKRLCARQQDLRRGY